MVSEDYNLEFDSNRDHGIEFLGSLLDDLVETRLNHSFSNDWCTSVNVLIRLLITKVLLILERSSCNNLLINLKR